jgi:ribosomal-protein-alanine N-acetyltransferase
MATIDNPVRIVPGTSEDLDAVMAIMEAAFGTRYGEAWTRSQCGGILPMAGVSLMLAHDRVSGKAVGFSLVRSIIGESELLLLAVAPDHRRRGIGRELLQQFLDSARADGVTRAHLEVRDGNPAIHMYRRAGFEPIGRRRNYYRGADGSLFDALTFALDI